MPLVLISRPIHSENSDRASKAAQVPGEATDISSWHVEELEDESPSEATPTGEESTESEATESEAAEPEADESETDEVEEASLARDGASS